MQPKLVRDKIPEIIKNDGKKPITRIANNYAYWIELKKKLIEEVNEFLKSENEEELADILEVIYALCDFKNFDKNNIKKIREEKAEKRGRFKDKIILESIE